MTGVPTALLAAGLGVWGACAALRFVRMYDLGSPLQRWRRWDVFRLVPTGAYFSPEPPTHRRALLVRDVLPDGRATSWTEVAVAPPRRAHHALWNPGKCRYRARSEACHDLLVTAGAAGGRGGALPPSFLLSEAYLHLLRHTSALTRPAPVAGVQFAVLEIDLVTRQVSRHVASAVHASSAG